LQTAPKLIEQASRPQGDQTQHKTTKKHVHNFVYQGKSPLYAFLSASLILLVNVVSLALSVIVVRWLLGIMPG
jgi:hypothetical protein